MAVLKEILTESLKDIAPSQVDILPSGYQRIGSIIMLNLNPKLRPLFSDIGNAVLSHSNATAVCARVGPIQGELREPRIEVIAGEGTVTTHQENGVFYRLDVTKVMFSKGNALERARVAEAVKKGETIVDMFAGIGYFTLPIAKTGRPSMIYAIEKNPVSMNFLKENIRLNNLIGRITPMLGDCREMPMGSVADRVIMGYLPDTWKFLETALSFLKPHGGIIHYHDVFTDEELWDMPMDYLERHAFRYGFHLSGVSNKKIVKQYGPGKQHVVIDAKFKAY
ncbi:MAG: class I SAM-dependent methyltransferase family protein [Candidatus Aenigmatarchaeota archaeon]